MKSLIGSVAVAAAAGLSYGSVINIDFSSNDDGDALLNGQQIIASDFDAFFTLSVSGSNNGAAVFDSSPGGPNAGSGDPDLLVDLGNVLIMQEISGNNGNTTVLSNGRTGFVTPNDRANPSSDPGVINFAFNEAVELLSIDLVDVNSGNSVTVTLTDSEGDERIYSVPQQWTDDISNPTPAGSSPQGFGTLDLTTLLDQDSPDGNGTTATAAEDAGFDAASVVNLEIRIVGSGAIDNLVFVPTPGAAGLLAVAGAMAMRRRR